jgi:hypothetical protein
MTSKNEAQSIKSHLNDIESDENIEVIAARDRGSRARGLGSDSSDYDVMFVYAEPPIRHAIGTASETMDMTIGPSESRLNTEIDLVGWELQKFIGNDGLAGSNPMALDFVESDDVYVQPSGVLHGPFTDMCSHVEANFKPYALINHLRSMAASNYGKYIEQDWEMEMSYEELQSEIGAHPKNARIDSETQELVVDVDSFEAGTATQDVKHIDLDEAADRDIIRKTTVDRTVKRYTNIVLALLRSKCVEETHDLPPLDADTAMQLAEPLFDDEQFPTEPIEELFELKRADGQTEAKFRPEINEWVETELDRAVNAKEMPSDEELLEMDNADMRDYEPGYDHVSRSPDVDFIRTMAEIVYADCYQVDRVDE